MRSLLAFMVVAGVMALNAVPARAQMESREGIALQNQILELRHDLQVLQQSQGGGYVAPPPRATGGGGGELSAQLLDRVQALEDEVRRLRGRLDEQANAARVSQQDLAKQIADLNFKLQNTGGGPAPQGGGPGPGPALGVPTGPATPVRRPPELAMQEGNAALARRDYDAAVAAAREVLAMKGPRSMDAQFLLSQALAGKRDYQGAAVAYDDAYMRAKTGPRAPDALLGMANALLALNDRGAACASLDKLRAEFPSARPAVREGAASLRGRAGCR